MCAHREHRTGNCRECFDAALNAAEPVELHVSRNTGVTIAMPLLWQDEGDNA